MSFLGDCQLIYGSGTTTLQQYYQVTQQALQNALSQIRKYYLLFDCDFYISKLFTIFVNFQNFLPFLLIFKTFYYFFFIFKFTISTKLSTKSTISFFLIFKLFTILSNCQIFLPIFLIFKTFYIFLKLPTFILYNFLLNFLFTILYFFRVSDVLRANNYTRNEYIQSVWCL